VPICFVSARSGAGVKELLDLFERLMPNPGRSQSAAVRQGQRPEAQPIRSIAEPDAGKHVIADVFKIVNDPFVGKLGMFRIYQGTVKRDTQLFIDDGKKPFKVGHLFKLKGKDHVEIEDASRRHRRRGQDRRNPLRRRAARQPRRGPDPPQAAGFPASHVRPRHRAAAQGPGAETRHALHKLAEEDPCFRVEHNKELNETVIRGLSDLHLR
jgi:elongation factor G